HPRFANRIIMGADPVAVDVVCTHIMMQNPRIRHLQWAADFGLGNDNLDYINIHGMPLEEAKLPFMSPAGEIEEQTCGRMRLTDLGSCSLCRVVVQSSLFRFSSPDSLIKDVEIVYGPGEWDTSGGKSQCSLLVGDCIREEYRSMGAWVPGCPVSREGFIEALAAQDIVCSKCEQAVNTFIENHKPEELEFVRILASNKTVYQSAANMAGPTDFLLAVGNCQLPYARFHVTRSKDELIQMGIADKVSADFFVIHIPGHNPSQDELEAALSELKKRAEKWEALQKD
ncbi:MAG: hypothetical protein FWH02_09265, partial [Oscillospiraceae bacterium]|nr:hypothetical protein [Oscillospiraceae bacterium]